MDEGAAAKLAKELAKQNKKTYPFERDRVLRRFLHANPGIHFRGIASNPTVKEWFSISMLQRHLPRLEQEGFLRSEQDGNRVRYFHLGTPPPPINNNRAKQAFSEFAESKFGQAYFSHHRQSAELLKRLGAALPAQRQRVLDAFEPHLLAEFVFMLQAELMTDAYMRIQEEIGHVKQRAESARRAVVIGWLRFLHRYKPGRAIEEAEHLAMLFAAGIVPQDSDRRHAFRREAPQEFATPEEVKRLIFRLNRDFPKR